MDDLIALAGLLSFLAGIYLWLGLAAVLIILGVILIYTAARIQTGSIENESNQATDTDRG